MHLGKYVESDLNFEQLAGDIGTSTKWGQSQLIQFFKTPTDDIDILTKRRNVIIHLRKHFRKSEANREKIQNCLARAAKVEAELASQDELIQKDERVQEYYKQIMWERDSMASFLNENKLWLEASNVWKVWLLPAITILIPIMIVILPFIIVRIAFHSNLSVTEYWSMLRHLLEKNGGAGNMISGILLPPWVGSEGMTVSQRGQKWMQWGVSVFMFCSSIWQQISLSRHLHSITADMRKRGEYIFELQQITNEITQIVTPVIHKYMEFPINPEIVGDNMLRVFGYTWNHPGILSGLTANLGILDVMLSCSLLKNIGFPTFVDEELPSLVIERFYHPHLIHENGKGKIITNSIRLGTAGDKRNNAIITGPNRGGKSTALKSILTNVILAQSLGFCFAYKMTITPFKQIHTALSPSDTLGRLSLFEAEIQFAKNILEYLEDSKNGKALLVMDEIFHSTNALDGEEASRIFLTKLYNLPALHISLISTHYVKLPEQYAEEKIVEALCLGAKKKEDGNLEYTYQIKDGINSLSSVHEILKERGLI